MNMIEESIPNQLLELVEECRDALDHSTVAHLSLQWRRKIWILFGPRQMQGNKAIFTQGHFRRTMLEVSCVKKVLPIWKVKYPNIRIPQDFLVLVEKYLAGETDYLQVSKRLNVLLSALDSEDPRQEPPLWVGYAASAAVGTALQDVSLWPRNNIIDEQTEQDFDEDEWDAAYLAAAAFTGGIPGETENTIEAIGIRREFWRWYLYDAVPAAWKSK
jgi:hypothetical protein